MEMRSHDGKKIGEENGYRNIFMHVIKYYIQLENFWSPTYPIIVSVNTNI